MSDDARVEALKQELLAERRQRLRERVERALLAAGLDPEYAELQAAMALQRARVKDETTLVLDTNKGRLTGDDAADAYAEEVVADAPEKWRTEPGTTRPSAAASRHAGITVRSDAELREAQAKQVGYARP